MFFFNFTKFLRSSGLSQSNMAALNQGIFSKTLVVCSSVGPKISAFGSHSSANFEPILDCCIPNFKLRYEDSENIKADRASTVIFNLNQVSGAFLGHPVQKLESC